MVLFEFPLYFLAFILFRLFSHFLIYFQSILPHVHVSFPSSIFQFEYRLPALNRSTSESPETQAYTTTTYSRRSNSKSKPAIVRSNTEIIQSKSKNPPNKLLHNKFKTSATTTTTTTNTNNNDGGGSRIVANAYLKPVKKFKKLSTDFRKVDCMPAMASLDSSICGKITLKKIKTKFKKKKNDDGIVLSSSLSFSSSS